MLMVGCDIFFCGATVAFYNNIVFVLLFIAVKLLYNFVLKGWTTDGMYLTILNGLFNLGLLNRFFIGPIFQLQ